MDYTVLQEWICSKHPNATLLRDEVILSEAPADLQFMQKWELAIK